MAQPKENARPRTGAVQKRAGSLGWGNVRFFLELARSGSLAQAAARTGVHRNTIIRHVAALERELGLSLFDRGPQGWTPTSGGEELVELALRVEKDILALARHVDASERQVKGNVRLTTAFHVATHLLVPELPSLRSRHPDLVVEIAGDQRTLDLTRREADLAVRVGRPRAAAGLVTRKMAEIAYALYASPAYMDGRRAADFERDTFVGFDDSLAGTQQERWLARLGPRRHVAFRCNGSDTLLAAARAGLGIALLPCFVADQDPRLLRLPPGVPFKNELWLLVHGELRHALRVRAVIEWLDDVLERAARRLGGVAGAEK
jgi:DNA-binding transcriptional LysR family regulator